MPPKKVSGELAIALANSNQRAPNSNHPGGQGSLHPRLLKHAHVIPSAPPSPPAAHQSEHHAPRAMDYLSALARGLRRKLMPRRLIAFIAAIVSVRSTRSFSENTAAAAA